MYDGFPQNKTLSLCFSIFLIPLLFSFAYNLYASVFPLGTLPLADDGEHLHVAYLLGQGKRPFIDFMENHPMLFNHFLWQLHEIGGDISVRTWNIYSRIILLGHFLLCILSLTLWAAQIIRPRLQGRSWFIAVLLALCMTGFFHDFFYFNWHLRPDYISHAYTLLGSYLVYISFYSKRPRRFLWLLLGGMLIGFGNAILPKGVFLLLPMILVLISSWLLRLRDIKKDCLDKANILSASVAAISIAISFLLGMLLDCRLSNISPTNWLSGVVHLNSKKHIIYTVHETNPVTSVVNAFGLDFLSCILLLLWGIWQCGRINVLSSENRHGDIYLTWFLFFVIAIGLLLPSFSNGVTWPYTYIPSLFAVFLIYLLIVNRIGYLLSNDNILTIKWRVITLFVLVILFFSHILLPQLANAYIHFQSRHAEQKIINILAPDDYLPEVKMPKDLTYLSQFPHQAPIKAMHWEYHFFLVLDHGFWQDSYNLGLGPDPATWTSKFLDNPPDVLAFSNDQEILEYIVALSKCQNIANTLILNKIKEEYQRITNQGVSIYIKKIYVQRMLDSGWRVHYDK
jgi:hypothetical protein